MLKGVRIPNNPLYFEKFHVNANATNGLPRDLEDKWKASMMRSGLMEGQQKCHQCQGDPSLLVYNTHKIIQNQQIGIHIISNNISNYMLGTPNPECMSSCASNKINVLKHLQKPNVDCKYSKYKLFGGSENQEKQDYSDNNLTINKKTIKTQLNQNKNFIQVEIRKQNQNSNSICHNNNKIIVEKPQDQSRKNPIQNQNENNKIIQLDDLITKRKNIQKNLENQDLKFLKSIFKLDHYINSGGEADIFANIGQQTAFRVIKINEQGLEANLSEIKNIKQFQEEGEYILDLQSSHLIENKFNNQKYMIHIMQICEGSLIKEYNKILNQEIYQKLMANINSLILVLQRLQNINNSFHTPKMYTDYYRPQNKVNKNLPFYHDIYSVAKTIELVLKKLNNEAIKNQLENLIQKLLQDDENSIKINCFQLPQQFINCLIDKNDPEIKEFLEIYLDQIEEYLIINRKINRSNTNLNFNMLKQLLKYQKFKIQMKKIIRKIKQN
ncbi:hypothetical protein ABPG72_020852 [Tetrahymena utriculariae]